MNHSHGHEHEYDFEASPGLPEPLPAREKILWQGAPQWRAMAWHVFHVRKVALYFAAMWLWQAAYLWEQGGDTSAMVQSLSISASLAVMGLGLLLGSAWMSARNALYTITDRRVVMRYGIALTLTYNLPFARIDAADVRLWNNQGVGDISLQLNRSDRIGWVHLWPHNRPWHMKHPQPSLRCVANASEAGRVLAQAWSVLRNSPMAAPAATLTPANSTPQGVQTQWA